MKHTLTALVENEFGVLTRIAGLFSGRGYNIQSLTVAETLDPKVSRMTLVTSGSDPVIEQITKQLNKLVNVIKVQDVTMENPVDRILAIIRVVINQKTRPEIIKAVGALGAEILDVDSKSCMIEVTGDENRIKSALHLFKPYGILDFVQTGEIALQRGKKT